VSFQTPLILQADSEPDRWIISVPLVWTDPVFGRLVVPCGFRTDLASIPRLVRNLPFLDPDGISRQGAAAHDWLYAWRGWGKAKADDFLRAALRAEGASALVAGVFYWGVSIFGDASWDSDAGALETRDFVTPGAYSAWRMSAA
jgi:hypothetical protein